ncbi:MAG: hypothetical protein SF069_07005 [Phycisphaerae bacterium]|nr:hypothetical protein [Phycisphaerae bacterium]
MSGYERVVRQTWWIFLAMLALSIFFGIALDPILGFGVFVVCVGTYLYFVMVRGSGMGGER